MDTSFDRGCLIVARTQSDATVVDGADATVPTDAPGLDAGTTGEAGAAAPDVPLTPEAQAALDKKKADRKARRALRSYVVVPMPADMKARFETDAKTADKPIGPFVRDFLAQTLGIEIPVTTTTRRVKYATDTERDAAKVARRQERSGTMKALMAQFRALTKGGMSPEQAVLAASQNVASGTPVPAEEQAPATAPEEVGAPA